MSFWRLYSVSSGLALFRGSSSVVSSTSGVCELNIALKRTVRASESSVYDLESQLAIILMNRTRKSGMVDT